MRLMQTNPTRLLLLAAESGDAAAQFNLAVLCDSRLDDNGYPIEGNRVVAMKWLLAAAEQGLPRAQSKLTETLCCTDQQPGEISPRIDIYLRRTYYGRRSSSMRFSEATAMATSVVCRRSVRERSASLITPCSGRYRPPPRHANCNQMPLPAHAAALGDQLQMPVTLDRRTRCAATMRASAVRRRAGRSPRVVAKVDCHPGELDPRILSSRWRPKGVDTAGLFERLHELLGGDPGSQLAGRGTRSIDGKAGMPVAT